MAQLQAHVLHHAPRTEPRCIASAKVAVHLVEAESRVLQCAAGTFFMQLGNALVGRFAQRMLVRTGNARVLDGFHLDSSLKRRCQ
jgi:hypothetical protein